MSEEDKPGAAESTGVSTGRGADTPDLASYSRTLQTIGLEYPVIAVKFSADEPTDLPRLGKRVALCEMLKEAQTSEAFYASADDHGCRAGSFVLGQIEHDAVAESGRIGPALGVYESAEANKRVYADMMKFAPGDAPFTLFARLDEARFAPDLVIVTARPYQAEVILRAHGYDTGAAWEARGTTVLGCVYLYAYPHFTGKLNVLISGLHHGMRARNLFPEGLLFITIPSPLVRAVFANLATMDERGLIDLPQYHWGKEAHERHMREVAESLAQQEL